MAQAIQIIFRSLEYGSMYALAALGVILIFRTSLIANFAQGVLGMFSTYVVAKMMIEFNINIWLAFLMGILSAIALGFIIDISVIRHAGKVNHMGKQILTMGILSIILGLSPIIFGVFELTLPRFLPPGNFNISGVSISHNGVFNIIVTITLMSLLFYLLLKTKAGLAIRMTASNESTATLMGVPTKTVTMMSWAMAAVLSLIAGMMAAPFSTVSLTFMNTIQLNAFLAVVFGGFQTFYGPVIAAYLIAIMGNIMQYYLPNGTVWGEPLLYLLILIFLVIRPYGLFGKQHVKKV